MDKFLFGNLYQISADQKASKIFPESNTIVIPFTTTEFDDYHSCLIGRKSYMADRFKYHLSYVKITNFLNPVDDDLYEDILIQPSLLGKLDLDLKLLPYRFVCEMTRQCNNIQDMAHRRDVVKFYSQNPFRLTLQPEFSAMSFLRSVKPIIKELGEDYHKIVDLVEKEYAERSYD